MRQTRKNRDWPTQYVFASRYERSVSPTRYIGSIFAHSAGGIVLDGHVNCVPVNDKEAATFPLS